MAATTAPDSPTCPIELRGLIFKRHILADEQSDDYDALLNKIAASVQPQDAVEWFWVKDIVDAIWEATRLRDIKAQILQKRQYEILVDLLTPELSRAVGLGPDDRRSLDRIVRLYLRGDERVKVSVNERLTANASTAADVFIRAWMSCLAEYERIDHMIAISDSRRYAVLRDIDRRRAFSEPRAKRALGVVEQGGE